MRCLLILVFLLIGNLSWAQSNELQALSKSDPALFAYWAGEFDQAFSIWHARAENGNPEAQFFIGLLYLEGRGTNVNERIAAEWFLKAARNDYKLAFIELAALLEIGVNSY